MHVHISIVTSAPYVLYPAYRIKCEINSCQDWIWRELTVDSWVADLEWAMYKSLIQINNHTLFSDILWPHWGQQVRMMALQISTAYAFQSNPDKQPINLKN